MPALSLYPSRHINPPPTQIPKAFSSIIISQHQRCSPFMFIKINTPSIQIDSGFNHPPRPWPCSCCTTMFHMFHIRTPTTFLHRADPMLEHFPAFYSHPLCAYLQPIHYLLPFPPCLLLHFHTSHIPPFLHIHTYVYPHPRTHVFYASA